MDRASEYARIGEGPFFNNATRSDDLRNSAARTLLLVSQVGMENLFSVP